MAQDSLSLFVRDQTPIQMVPRGPILSDHMAEEEPGIRHLWRILVRRRWLIILTILALTGSAAGVISTLTPRYTAAALLMVGDQQPHMLDLQSVVTGVEAEITESEIQVIRSRRIARMVIEKLNLLHDPNFMPVGHQPLWLSEAARQVSQFWTRTELWLGLSSPSAKRPAGLESEIALSHAVDSLISHLAVTAKGRSRAVDVQFESASPQIAAAVTNAVAQTYIQDELDTKMLANVQANQWLTARVADLRSQVIGTDRLVQQRKSDAGITEGKQVDLINEQISSLSEQLILAEADEAQADSKVGEAQHASRIGTAISDVAASPVIQKLRGDQAELHQKIAEVSQRMGEKNPVLMQLRAQLSANTAALNGETSRIVSSLTNSASTAHSRSEALRRALATLKQEAGTTGAADVEINAQEREAQANHALYDRLLSRAKETSIESGLPQPHAHIISIADIPVLPTFPNKPLIMALSLIGATLVAVLLVIGLESIDQGFRDLNQVEAALGVSALGFIPTLRSDELPETHVLSRPFSAYSEAIRGIYTSLILSDVDHPPKIVLITSSLPGEGKSTTAIALARLVSRSGKKVVVIDSDLRNPRVHLEFGVPIKPGLADYLANRVSIEDVLLKDRESDAFVLPPGTYAPNPTDMFSSDNMQRLLRALSSTFDLIILDSAPLLAVSDTRNLCRLADKVLFVVRWQHTRKAAAAPAVRQVLAAGGNMAGILLTMTDMKRLPNLAGSAYYQRQLSSYYETPGA
ncbi:MAG: exoP [Rhodospirillales bacterium]|nr:exoP [Rhodospirillales bacterium]